jgi:hypothetical protein
MHHGHGAWLRRHMGGGGDARPRPAPARAAAAAAAAAPVPQVEKRPPPAAAAAPAEREPERGASREPERAASALAKATEVRSLRKPRPLARSPRCFQRPTLSAQLAKIGRQAEQVTAALSASFELARHDDALLSAPAKAFVVGKLQAKLPAIVYFLGDRCEYAFTHPFEPTVIHMVMYFGDFVDPVVSPRALCFRVPGDLMHYGRDYDPRNSAHVVRIDLHSEHDANKIADFLAPRCADLRISR